MAGEAGQAAADWFAAAVADHGAGRFRAARSGYRVVLAADPQADAALHLLAMLALNDGAAGRALCLVDRAIVLAPLPLYAITRADALRRAGRLAEAVAAYRSGLSPGGSDLPRARLALAETLRDLDRVPEAIAAYRAAVAADPERLDARFTLALLLHRQGREAEAEPHYRTLLALGADPAAVHGNLAAALTSLGRRDEAGASARAALAADPAFADAHLLLGTLANERGDWSVGEHACRRALSLRPGDVAVLNNLGNAILGAGRAREALRLFDRCLRLAPGLSDPHNNRGLALQALGQGTEADAAFRTALALSPLTLAARTNLGRLWQSERRYAEAARAFRSVTVLAPGDAEAHCNFGNVLAEADAVAGARAAYARALRLVPTHAVALSQIVRQDQLVCRWDALPDLAGRLLARIRQGEAAGSPFVLLGVDGATPADQRGAARAWVRERARDWNPPGTPAFIHPPRPRGRRIRLGYLSADLHAHATAYLMAEQFERHDRARFETVAYSCGPDDGSDMRRRLTAAFDRFVDLRGVTDEAAGRLIHDEAVDILVDLKGYTAYARTGIAARRPAPLAMQHVGYAGTMGAPFIDYLIADPVTVPAGDDPLYDEAVIRLPWCYQPNDGRRAIAASVPTRSEAGLPAAGVVFCCFNSPYKIGPAMFDIWMRLLRGAPGSVLWLLDANPLVAGNLRREAAARGVAPERLVFAPRARLPDHLARHRLADLFLDTLPYNAHTTASDALWAGLPVVTCRGGTFAGRVASSLLRAVGLPELITSSLADYEALAASLAADPHRLASLRARLGKLRERCPLFDATRFTRALESGYELAWDRHLGGARPASFDVPDAETGTRDRHPGGAP